MDPTIQNISKQTEVPVPPSPTRSPFHKTPILLMGFFVLLVIGAFFAGTYYQGMNKRNEAAQTTQPSPTVSQPSPTSDPTADWKTYAGKSFSFQYPSDWELSEKTPKGFEVVPITNTNYPFRPTGKMFGTCTLYLTIPGHSNALVALEVMDSKTDGGYCWSYGYFYDDTVRTIANLTPPRTIKVSKWRHPIGNYDEKPGQTNWLGDYFQSTFFQKSNETVSFALLNQDTNKAETEEVFDQILNTFKFLDTTATNSASN